MAMGGVSLSACGTGDVGPTEGSDATTAYFYGSLQACRDQREVPDDACDTAARIAVADDRNVATWPDQTSCERVHGQNQCTPPSAVSGHGTFWGPLLMGFVVGRARDGSWGGRALYRDWRAGSYYAAGGGRVWRSYPTGRMHISQRSFDPPDYRRGPERMLCKGAPVSRSGFGSRMARGCTGEGGWGG
jgi:uncharacterized protein YgiB involved in biofilm formation